VNENENEIESDKEEEEINADVIGFIHFYHQILCIERARNILIDENEKLDVKWWQALLAKIEKVIGNKKNNEK